jgi:hypothetical protein
MIAKYHEYLIFKYLENKLDKQEHELLKQKIKSDADFSELFTDCFKTEFLLLRLALSQMTKETKIFYEAYNSYFTDVK